MLFNLRFSRPTTPQTAPVMNTRRKQASLVEPPPPIETTTPKRGRKSTKSVGAEEQPPAATAAAAEPVATDRPVRIALSSHLVRSLPRISLLIFSL